MEIEDDEIDDKKYKNKQGIIGKRRRRRQERKKKKVIHAELDEMLEDKNKIEIPTTQEFDDRLN